MLRISARQKAPSGCLGFVNPDKTEARRILERTKQNDHLYEYILKFL